MPKVVAHKTQIHLKKIVCNVISIMQSLLNIRKLVNVTYYPNLMKNFLKLPGDSGKKEFIKLASIYDLE